MARSKALLRIDDGGLPHHHVGLLQVVVDGEQQVAFLDVVAFAHLQRLDAALLVGRNENQLGLDPALQHAVIGLAAAGERERGEQR